MDFCVTRFQNKRPSLRLIGRHLGRQQNVVRSQAGQLPWRHTRALTTEINIGADDH